LNSISVLAKREVPATAEQADTLSKMWCCLHRARRQVGSLSLLRLRYDLQQGKRDMPQPAPAKGESGEVCHWKDKRSYFNRWKSGWPGRVN